MNLRLKFHPQQHPSKVLPIKSSLCCSAHCRIYKHRQISLGLHFIYPADFTAETFIIPCLTKASCTFSCSEGRVAPGVGHLFSRDIYRALKCVLENYCNLQQKQQKSIFQLFAAQGCIKVKSSMRMKVCVELATYEHWIRLLAV